MIMPGREKAPQELLRLIQSTTNLTFIDTVPFAGMQDYFNRAKCFVNTSDFEGFPNTFIQAGFAATPILSFSVNPDNLIDTRKLGCFCQNSLEKAVGFISSLDADAIGRYGNNARAYVTENHNIADKIKQYQELITALV